MVKQRIRYLKLANTLALLLFFFLNAAYIAENFINEVEIYYPVVGLILLVTFIILVSIIRVGKLHYKFALNVPITLFFSYTLLMMLSKWSSPHYLFVCLAFSALSCVYSRFIRTVAFIVMHNLFIGLFILRGVPVSGPEVPLIVTLINWGICIFISIIMLMVTRYATVHLTRALEHQNSFASLLDTTENYIAMVDETNRIVYASKTMSQLSDVEDPALVQGRPFMDLFPGKSLKLYAGQMLKEKDLYAEDWEFMLNGQKRYFKAAAHSVVGSTDSLISLYDMTHLAERDEIAAMKDSMKIGLFFMDKDYVIQDHYSRFLEEMLSETRLFGRLFTDIIADSVNPNEMSGIKDYFDMVRERSLELDMLDDINPLNELHYVNTRTGDKKVLQCAFSTVDRGQDTFLLVTVYDITTKVELEQRLAEEEAKRQEEMQAVFELISVDPGVFKDFLADMDFEFESIDKAVKDQSLKPNEVLVKIYQSAHAIKSNAVILGLNVFGNKVHNLESKIKKMRDQEGEVPFAEMLNLTMDIDKLSQEREGFKEIIEKIQSYASSGGGGKQNVKVLVDSLAKTTERCAEDSEKQVKFSAAEIDPQAVDKGPRRIMKDILMQLIRNSVIHGIEAPEARKEKGKKEIGLIKCSIKLTEDLKHVHIKLSDDGAGLNYEKIKKRALENKVLTPEEAENKDALSMAIFAPGFSTAETEGVHAGRGIGLNLVKDRIKEIGGNIKLRSEPDKGTLFFVSLPVEKAPK